MSNTIGTRLPKPSDTSITFSPEQLDWLERTFPEPKVRPGMQMDTAMYEAGQASVVQGIRQRVQHYRTERIQNV